ncbi:MAG: GDSL-type esterase/lipase family protein [Spirosomataceae bacterium]
MKPIVKFSVSTCTQTIRLGVKMKNVLIIFMIIHCSYINYTYGQQRSGEMNKQINGLDFDWEMEKRFTTKVNLVVNTKNTERVGYGYDSEKSTYFPSYVNPNSWEVSFFISNPFNQTLNREWKIVDGNGREIALDRKETITPASKQGKAEALLKGTSMLPDYKVKLPKLGIYTVTLTITDDTGNKFLKTKQIELKDFLIVSIGDSFSSGEGNPDVDGVTNDEILCENFTTMTKVMEKVKDIDMKKYPVWLEPKAHRSLKSGSAKAAELLEEADPHSSVTFLTFACSGAKITQGLLYQQHSTWQQKGQVDEVKEAVGNRKIDALVMSIGINDLLLDSGISGLINCAANPAPPQFQDSDELKSAFSQLEKLPQLYARLNQKINSSLNVSSVFLYEIPINMFRDKDNNPMGGCGILRYIEKQDAIIIDRIGVDLNRMAQMAGQRHGWHYLSGIVEAFRGHGYCESPKDSWYRAGGTSCKCQGDFDGTIHPNEAGHTKIGSILFERLKSALSNRNELQGLGAFPH